MSVEPRPMRMDASGEIVPLNDSQFAQYKADATASAKAAANPQAPDGPTLGDWRVGLLLWDRLDDVSAKITTLCENGEPMGFVAKERFEYSNNVFRKELMSLKVVLGFSDADVEESLWRASRVSLGDLSGIYP